MTTRDGFSLLELLVVLAVLAVVTGVAVPTTFQRSAARHDEFAASVRRARVEAVVTGRAVRVSAVVQGPMSRTRWATAFPDGSVVAEAPDSVDRLSGVSHRLRP